MNDPVVRRNAAILSEVGFPLGRSARILDYGCGRGAHVEAYREAGYDAWGCDIVIERAGGFLREMDTRDFRIPFEDGSFDFVYSNSVLEHVSDQRIAAAELARVMKPDGVGLHNFPSKWRLVEPHVFVPLATVFRPWWWLRLWAGLGVRNSHQVGRAASDVARLNQEYLHTCTNYQTKVGMAGFFRGLFRDVRNIELIMLRHESGRAHKYVYPVARRVPVLAEIYGVLHTRMLFVRK
jgi:SAM-dependent methyltransferase